MILQAIFFYLFAGVCIASAIMVIVARNPVHSVLFLILAFVNAAGLFMLMGAEFLAMILIVVYVGAVAVLFLFVVMMLDVDFAELRHGLLNYLPIGFVVGAVLLAELLFVVGACVIGARRARRPSPRRSPATSATRRRSARYSIPATLYFFEAAGMILLVAMIGAIVMTLQHKPDVRRQRVARAARAHPRQRHRGGQGQRQSGRACAMTIGLGHYLSVAAILFTLGIFGIFLNRKNIIIILMSVELILLAVNINLVAFSAFLGDIVGQVYALIVLTVAAAEAAIGLAILVAYFRNRGSIAVEDVNLMKG